MGARLAHEQKCECRSDRHDHKAGECDKPATREDKRCDDCREAEAEAKAATESSAARVSLSSPRTRTGPQRVLEINNTAGISLQSGEEFKDVRFP